MPDEQLLLTVLHISDLHFGEILEGENADQLSARVPPFLAKFPHLEGLLGHHYKGVAALHDFYSTLWELQDSQKPVVIVTGDVTAYGAPNQFSIANGFLGAETPQSLFPIGLGVPDWQFSSISGNHDYWSGSGLPIGPPSSVLRECFAQPFPYAVHIELQGGSKVSFLFIDSDADVDGVNRFFARGDFVSQLDNLNRTLPSIEENEFRVLVLHHSICHSGPRNVSARPAT